MTAIARAFRNFVSRDDGAALVEYAVLLVLVAIACIVAAAFLGQNISKMFDSAATKVAGS
jgi:Flp pilus assembly pilin Flp